MPSAPDLAARRAAAEAGNVRVLSQFVDQAIQVYTQGPSSTQELQSFRAQSARVAIMDGAANQDVEAFHIEWVETMKRLHAHLSGKPLEQVIAVLGKNWERGITDWLCAHEPGTLPHTDPIFKSLWGDERRPRIHPVGSRHGLMGRLAPGQRELLAHTIEPAFREAVAWTLEGAPLARLAGLPVHDERTRARRDALADVLLSGNSSWEETVDFGDGKWRTARTLWRAVLDSRHRQALVDEAAASASTQAQDPPAEKEQASPEHPRTRRAVPDRIASPVTTTYMPGYEAPAASRAAPPSSEADVRAPSVSHTPEQLKKFQSTWDSLLVLKWREDVPCWKLCAEAERRGLPLAQLARVPSFRRSKRSVRVWVGAHLTPLSERLFACTREDEFIEAFLWLKKSGLSVKVDRAAIDHSREVRAVERETQKSMDHVRAERRAGQRRWEASKRSNWNRVK